MNHPSDEQLILHHYGDAEDGDEIARHLDGCEACRLNYAGIQRTLSAVNALSVPERSEAYGADVWRKLRPQIVERTASRRLDWFALFAWPRWALAGTFAALVIGAFLAGRQWSGRPTEPVVATIHPRQPISPEARQRILLREIGDHLERSQLALIELINSQTNGAVDISLERTLARQLVDVNRLYQQTTSRLGETGMASVLEDLERTLLEIANSPSQLSAAEFADLRQRIDSDGVLFKVKVMGSQLRARETETVRELAGKRS